MRRSKIFWSHPRLILMALVVVVAGVTFLPASASPFLDLVHGGSTTKSWATLEWRGGWYWNSPTDDDHKGASESRGAPTVGTFDRIRTQPLHLVQQRIDVGFRGEWIHDILQRELSSHAERLQRGALVRILSEVQGLGESPMVGFIELLEQAVHAD